MRGQIIVQTTYKCESKRTLRGRLHAVVTSFTRDLATLREGLLHDVDALII